MFNGTALAAPREYLLKRRTPADAQNDLFRKLFCWMHHAYARSTGILYLPCHLARACCFRGLAGALFLRCAGPCRNRYGIFALHQLHRAHLRSDLDCVQVKTVRPHKPFFSFCIGPSNHRCTFPHPALDLDNSCSAGMQCFMSLQVYAQDARLQQAQKTNA